MSGSKTADCKSNCSARDLKDKSDHPEQRLSKSDWRIATKLSHCQSKPFHLMEDRRNPMCYFGWGGLLVLIFGGFSLGYGYSRRGRDFTTHRKGLIIAGGVAIGLICVGIIICVLFSWRRKRAAAFDEERLVISEPMTRPPNLEPPMTANQNNLHRDVSTESPQRADQQNGAQQNNVDSLPEKPPPAYSERPDDRVYRDPNPSSLLNV